MITDSRLVIFDCDGVLVDSEPISNRVFCDMLNDLGLSVTLDEMYEHFVGLSMPQCMERVTAMLGCPPPEGFEASVQQRTEEELRAHVQPVEGVREVLNALHLSFCVASGGAHSKIRTTLGATGLLGLFGDRIFSAEDVKRPKPAPDLFLHAASTLGYLPARCLVVEDTPTGVRAGVAAGMRVFGFGARSRVTPLLDAGAHETFRAMGELTALVERWVRSSEEGALAGD